MGTGKLWEYLLTLSKVYILAYSFGIYLWNSFRVYLWKWRSVLLEKMSVVHHWSEQWTWSP